MADLTDADIRRRVEAKRLNERLKLAASALNTFGIASLTTTIIAPSLVQTPDKVVWLWVPFSFCAMITAQGVLGFIQSED